MSKNDRKNSVNSKGFQRKSGQKSFRKEGLKRAKNIVFGLSYKDNNQGQNYKDWESEELLSQTISRLQALCSMTMEQAKQQQIIKEYDAEMPEGTTFERPKHIPEDIKWASIRIQGKVRVIGFIEDNFVFQIVFLDKEHEFYPSKKKHT